MQLRVRVAALVEERDRVAVDPVERGRVVAESLTPVGVGAPGRRFEHQADARASGDVGVPVVVLREELAPLRLLDQRERRELREVDAVVKDQVGLEPAVGDVAAVLQKCGHNISVPFQTVWSVCNRPFGLVQGFYAQRRDCHPGSHPRRRRAPGHRERLHGHLGRPGSRCRIDVQGRVLPPLRVQARARARAGERGTSRPTWPISTAPSRPPRRSRTRSSGRWPSSGSSRTPRTS